jgi:cytochrome c553
MFTLFMGANAALAGGDAAAGEEKAASCGMCHGAAGEGTSMGPKLAGTDEAAFVEAMEAYKSGARENAMMQGTAASLSEQDFADLAAYYAGLGGE